MPVLRMVPRWTQEQGKSIGTVHGFEQHRYEFEGISYAVPPAGNHRWKPPEAAGAWSGGLLDIRFGPDCVQSPYETSSFHYRPLRPLSEDCPDLIGQLSTRHFRLLRASGSD
jgi:carboxylesterase type B